MDTNILSCAKCGHTLNETAETCAYCGTAVSSADSPPQPDAEAPGQTAQPVEAPPSPADDSPPVLEMNDEGLYGHGQLAMLLRARYCDPRIRGINKTDGLTWKVKEILERVEQRLAQPVLAPTLVYN